MAYKTGGFKTRYIYEYGPVHKEYTIYRAVESVSDTCVYKMIDGEMNEAEICISAEDDTDSFGNRSLIECLYHLKLARDKPESREGYGIVIEEMTDDEIKTVFGR